MLTDFIVVEVSDSLILVLKVLKIPLARGYEFAILFTYDPSFQRMKTGKITVLHSKSVGLLKRHFGELNGQK